MTVGGYPAKHVVLTVREDLGCDPGYFYSWQAMWWGALWPETRVGYTIRVWIVDVGGTLLFFEAETTDQADTELQRREIEQNHRIDPLRLVRSDSQMPRSPVSEGTGLRAFVPRPEARR